MPENIIARNAADHHLPGKARAIHNMRVPDTWKIPLAENRLLVLSPFDQSRKRTTAKLAKQRNTFVAALSDELFVIHAQQDTETFRLAVEAIRAGKKIVTIRDEENQALLQVGAST